MGVYDKVLGLNVDPVEGEESLIKKNSSLKNEPIMVQDFKISPDA